MGPRRYRKKPVVVLAMQYRQPGHKAGGNVDELLQFCMSIEPTERWSEDFSLYVSTLEDGGEGDDALVRHVLSNEDWLVQGIQGEFYPVKPDIFAATYALADDE